jgi:cystathionine gamma-synthase
LIDGAHELGMDAVVDNTFASPLLQQPLALGADVVVHSVTKLLSGHSDVVMGAAVTKRADVLEQLVSRRSLHGAIAGPWEVWLALRGVRTLALRVERSCANAMVLAERLGAHPRVASVRYPGLPSDPGHERAARQMKAFGCVVTFVVAGGGGGGGGADGGVAAATDAALARLKVITVGTSLGGVETLVERRARVEGDEGLPPGLVRMSVGIEDVDDLWRDLDGALTG